MISRVNMQLLRLISEKQKAASDPEKLAFTQMIKANEELGEAAAELLAFMKSKNASASAAGSLDGMAEELVDVLSCVIDMLITQGVTEDQLNTMLASKLKKWGVKLLPRHHAGLVLHENLSAWVLWDRSYIELLSFNKKYKNALMAKPLTLAQYNKIMLGATPYARPSSLDGPVSVTRKEANDFIEMLNYVLACNSTDFWKDGFRFCLPTEAELQQEGIVDKDMDKYWLFPPNDSSTETGFNEKMVFLAFGK